MSDQNNIEADEKVYLESSTKSIQYTCSSDSRVIFEKAVGVPPKKKVALITGINGQDGSYLSRFLLDKGYDVHGIIRRSSNTNTDKIKEILNRITLHYGDLTDGSGLTEILLKVEPDEVYNLAAQSHVRVSFDIPEYTADTTGTGVLRLLDAVLSLKNIKGKRVKFYQASSSEMYGQVTETPQTERTPFHPRSPYGCAKVYAHWQTVNYRESYNLFACSGILFNHESPMRGEDFVTRKITIAAARIKHGLQDKLFLGNIDAKRDWGFAGDYVRAMWLMLQQPEPDDYVISTGETHSVREFLDEVFGKYHNLDWTKYVEIDPNLYRPAEVELLLGDSSKAREKLGWVPEYGFKDLAKMMAKYDDDTIKGIL